MESVASPKWMVSKRYATVWWASFWEKSLLSVGMCSLYPGWEWWAGALFPALRSKHATVWNRFLQAYHNCPTNPSGPGAGSPSCFHWLHAQTPAASLFHMVMSWRNSASVHMMLSKEVKQMARALSPPAEGEVSWDSVHRICSLWILGNLEVHTHLFVPGAWLPSRNKSWTPSYQCRTPGRCLFGEACVERKACSGIKGTRGFCHERLDIRTYSIF